MANDRDHSGGSGLLATRGLSVYYDQFQAVREVDFSIDAGEIVALIGANGAGKSSFLKALVGQVDRIEGAIEFSGRSLTRMSTPAISAAGIALVPEGRRLFPSLTVDENLRIGLSVGRRGPITLDQVYFTGISRPIKIKDLVYQTIKFSATYSTTNSEMLNIVTTNTSATL